MSTKYHLHIEATHRDTGQEITVDKDFEEDTVRSAVLEEINDLEDKGYRIDRLKAPSPDSDED